MKPEQKFEKDLKYMAAILGYDYIKIPDINPKVQKMLRKFFEKHGRVDSLLTTRRPCDSILIMPCGNFMIECKIGYLKLKPHQLQTQYRINNINHSFVVLRKIKLKKGFVYQIEMESKTGVPVKWRTDKIENIFKVIQEKR